MPFPFPSRVRPSQVDRGSATPPTRKLRGAGSHNQCIRPAHRCIRLSLRRTRSRRRQRGCTPLPLKRGPICKSTEPDCRKAGGIAATGDSSSPGMAPEKSPVRQPHVEDFLHPARAGGVAALARYQSATCAQASAIVGVAKRFRVPLCAATSFQPSDFEVDCHEPGGRQLSFETGKLSGIGFAD